MKMVEDQDTENKPPRRTRKKVYKMILRRLPIALTEEELLEKLSPLPKHERFWFRRGEAYLEDDGFPYAFIVFDEFDEAANFQTLYNGQIFTDSENNESTIIVEKAANQDFSKEPLKPKAGIRPITEDIGFIKFLEEADFDSVSKKVDFDVLVNEITERERRLAQGVCQETPLTDYFIKKAHEKIIKNRPKPKPTKSDKPETKKNVVEDKKEKAAREIRDAKPEGKEVRPKDADKKKRERPRRKDYEKKTLVKGADTTPAAQEVRILKQSSKDSEQLPSAPVSAKQPVAKLGETKPKNQVTTVTDSTLKQDEKAKEPKPVGPPKRNKDRPERAIYQPGRARRGGKTAPTTQAADAPAASENVKE